MKGRDCCKREERSCILNNGTHNKHTSFYCTDDTSWVCEGADEPRGKRRSSAPFVWSHDLASVSSSLSRLRPSVFLSILVIFISIYIPMCTYIYLYILCIFIQSNILAETCQPYIDEAISWEVIGGGGGVNWTRFYTATVHYITMEEELRPSTPGCFDPFLSTADL